MHANIKRDENKKEAQVQAGHFAIDKFCFTARGKTPSHRCDVCESYSRTRDIVINLR